MRLHIFKETMNWGKISNPNKRGRREQPWSESTECVDKNFSSLPCW